MTIILVEGDSDRVALAVIAKRMGLHVPEIVSIGGAHAIARVAERLLAQHPRERLIGLVDVGEVAAFSHVIPEVFTCDRDLEDEMIRSLGVDGALAVIKEQGELESFRTLQRQPAHRDRCLHDQLRQFLRGRSGNKARYAVLFAEAVDVDRIPMPLRDVILAYHGQSR